MTRKEGKKLSQSGIYNVNNKKLTNSNKKQKRDGKNLKLKEQKKGERKMIEAKCDNIVAEQLVRGKTSGGLIVPNTVTDPQAYGRITSVGEEVTKYKVGDIIIFHLNGGQTVILENKLLRVLKEGEIYGILKEEKVIETLEEAYLRKEGKVVTP